MLNVQFSDFSRPLRYLTVLSLLLSGVAGFGPLASAQQSSNAPSYSTDKQVIANGQVLFQNNCATCHNFRQKGIGPNLAGVTAAMSPAWMRTFIRNAPAQIEAGDKRAVALFKEYNQYMPAFPTLQETDLDAVLAYINASQNRESAGTKPDNMGESLTDPMPTKLAKSGLRLTLTEVMTAPASATAIPLARLNKMEVLPGKTNRLFIEDLRGKLYEMSDNTLKEYMDIARELPNFIHAPGLATGFGSYAFHPDFNKNGLLYTTHTEKAGTAPADFSYADSIKVTLQWVVTEWKVGDQAAATFAGKGRELFRINMVSPIHGMQEITFNPMARPGTPDYGMLYIGIGDGGATENGFDFICNTLTRPWSSVLRIDPRGTNSRNGRYGIPATNPYAKAKDPATAREVFCRGFRNPNRIYWTPDGKMLITDIGQSQAEELNIGMAGRDYGWPNREGTFMINPHGNMGKVYPLPANDAKFHYTYPVAQYDHDEGNAISGGFVYTGTAIPLLTGKYIFGDVVNGRIFYVDSKTLALGRQATIQELDLAIGSTLTTFRELSNSKKTDLRIGTGFNHDLFLYTKTDGKIYKVSGCERTAQ